MKRKKSKRRHAYAHGEKSIGEYDAATAACLRGVQDAKRLPRTLPRLRNRMGR